MLLIKDIFSNNSELTEELGMIPPSVLSTFRATSVLFHEPQNT
jgi:hypothetical protein